jgi:hypothetical protein
LRDIVVTQNFQIQGMMKVLELNNFASSADCLVEVSRNIESTDGNNNDTATNGNESSHSSHEAIMHYSGTFVEHRRKLLCRPP